MKKPKYQNFPLEECNEALQRIMPTYPPGSAFFQKWTCEGCDKRLTGSVPNKLFTGGHCDHCGHTTNLTKTGCNYSLHIAVGGLASVPPKGTS